MHHPCVGDQYKSMKIRAREYGLTNCFADTGVYIGAHKFDPRIDV